MEVKLIDHMGSDLTVVNAARVSFDKVSDWDSIPDGVPYDEILKDEDKNLIKYLAKHNHWTPFGHCSLQFHIKAPIFVARQLGKHQVGLVWNEVSRRYVDSKPEFFDPILFRGRAENKKQGSKPVSSIKYDMKPLIEYVTQCYGNMLDKGICPEQARMVLPQAMYTEWYWSGSLAAFARVCNLRCKKDTQLETRFIAYEISSLAEEHFPASWECLMTGDLDEL
jgi:thymidylate synthase (FAD)